MDFYKFLNSKDIREYHKEIGYEYSPIEAAWLINFSFLTSVKEKIEGWEWIIENMPDMPMEERRWCDYRPSLHQFLKDYIVFYKKHKKAFDKHEWPRRLSEEEKGLWGNSFDGIYMEFPVPFKKGDILTYPGVNQEGIEKPWDIFVLDYIVTKEYSSDKKASNWDTADMIIYGYAQGEDGSIWYDHFSDYIDMEFYDAPLTREYALLKAVSNTLKGNINLELLLQSQKKILIGNENATGFYTEEHLKMAGIEWEGEND